MKKTLSTLFFVLLAFIAFTLTISAREFADVSGHKHANAINAIAQLEIMFGYEDGTFRPDGSVTRAEMAKTICTFSGDFNNNLETQSHFEDVDSTDWFFPYANWCYQKGIVTDTMFHPYDRITYDYALQMVLGVLGYTDWDKNLFLTEIRVKALRDLRIGENLEYVQGTDNITRAQVAQILYNAFTAVMKDTKIVNVPIGDTGSTVSVEVPKTLAVDIWGVEECIYPVVGTENLSLDGYSPTKEDGTIVILYENGNTITYNVSDLDFDHYLGRTDELIGKEICIVISVDNNTLIGAYIHETIETEKLINFINFDDIDGNKHANAISVLSGLGIVGSYDGVAFKPDAKVTRAEMAKLVYLLNTTLKDHALVDTPFEDVENTHWASLYINWCYYKGIIGGNEFNPNGKITYDYALKMVCGALGYTQFKDSLYPTDIRNYALKALNLGENLEYLTGEDYLTRAQACQLLYNALFADMYETKIINIFLENAGYSVPAEVSKTLAVDYWCFEETGNKIVATQHSSLSGYKHTNEKNTILVSSSEGTYSYFLSDLGLDDYSENADELLGKEMIWLFDTIENEIFASAFVKKEEPEAIAIIRVSAPDKTKYVEGDTLDTTGMSVIGILNDGTAITLDAVASVSPMHLDTVGTVEVSVSYEGKSTYFDVSVERYVPGINKECATLINDKVLKGTPVIDGNIDYMYIQSLSVELHGPASAYILSMGATDTTATGTVYSLYDDNYVYVFFAVTDKTLLANDIGYVMDHPHPHLNDAVELRVGDDLEDHFAPYDGSNDAHHLFYADAYGRRFTNYEDSMGDDCVKLKSATRIVGDTYYVEMAIPVQKAFKEGDLIQFNFQIDDLQSLETESMAAIGLSNSPSELMDFYCGGSADASSEDIVNYIGTSLYLDGGVGIKLYFEYYSEAIFPESLIFNATLTNSKYNSVTEKKISLTLDTDTNIAYAIVHVPAKDINTISIGGMLSGKTVNGSIFTFEKLSGITVPKYIEELEKMALLYPPMKASLELTKAMETYCSYADAYFNNTDIEDIILTDLEKNDISEIANPILENKTVGGLEFYSTSLLLEGKIALRHYFKVNSDIDLENYTVEGGNELKLSENRLGFAYIDIENISANELAIQKTVTISNGQESSTITFSPYNYIKLAYNNENSRLNNLVKALYRYGVKAVEYN